jgi:hypothetical protein
MPHIHQALAWLTNNSQMEVRIENFPYCCIDGEFRRFIWERRSDDRRTLMGMYPSGRQEDIYYPLQERLRRKTKFLHCAQCACNQVCEGVYKIYAEKIGSSDFVPVRSTGLTAQRMLMTKD